MTAATSPDGLHADVTLRYPIEIDGTLVKSVRLRRITVQDLEIMAVERTEIAKNVRLIAQASGMAPDAIRKMDAADYNALAKVVADFLD
jgi:hypothetical protein